MELTGEWSVSSPVRGTDVPYLGRPDRGTSGWLVHGCCGSLVLGDEGAWPWNTMT